MKKTFVLDTNVLLHNAESVESFADNIVVIPMAVIEELDNFKKHNDELGRNARQVIRRIDALRTEGNLRDGVPLSNGGILKILSTTGNGMVSDLVTNNADNRIIQLAYQLHKEANEASLPSEGSEQSVIFVSKDINARLKADALGLKAEDFEKEKINFDELYTGYSEIRVSADTMEEFFNSEVLEMKGVGNYPNEFILLKDKDNEKHAAMSRVAKPGFLVHLSRKNESAWNIHARNKEQRMTLELLLDPEVQIVTLVGQAGTGKTLLALAAALQATLKNRQYERILVSRPIIPMGKDIGYLPGGKDEKLSNWMLPIFDNLSYLLRDGAEKSGQKKKSKTTSQDRMERLLREKTIELEALTYIRGRSIPGQYVIVDEAQNLTPHEVKTIISRAGDRDYGRIISASHGVHEDGFVGQTGGRCGHGRSPRQSGRF